MCGGRGGEGWSGSNIKMWSRKLGSSCTILWLVGGSEPNRFEVPPDGERDRVDRLSFFSWFGRVPAAALTGTWFRFFSSLFL